MELVDNENFILRRRDIVRYRNRIGIINEIVIEGYDGKTIKTFENTGYKILSIERPIKYEIVYESEFKKEDVLDVLDEVEKKYLGAVIKPFRSRVNYVRKKQVDTKYYININLINENDNIPLPYFEDETMYKGMELDKKYTLKELGL